MSKEILETKDEVKEEEGKESAINKPLDCTPENAKKVVESIAEEVRKDAGISEEQSAIFKQMCIDAEMPVEFLDKDFKLGPQELDIRKLSKRNLLQLFFRQQTLHQIYLKQILNSLVDITRLNLVLLDKLGVEDIVKATDDVQDKLSEQNKTNELNKK